MRIILVQHIALIVATLLSNSLVAEEPDYTTQIKPILALRCYSCHGSLEQEAGLRLDTGLLIRKGGENGPAIDLKQPSKSSLIERVSTKDDSLRMPPEGAPLTEEQIQLLSKWIENGGHSPTDEKPQKDPRQHWAFNIPSRPSVPQMKNRSWVRNPIDAFVSAAHQKLGLKPQPAASKSILLRRIYLDLIGLPPTAEQLKTFLADESPTAYEKVVDQLLDSPRYGERWGRHWMDVWRYSDWYGYRAELRNSARHIWRWRDWIVESLNEDKPYDQMVMEMLAGDELDPANPDVLRATGFLARNYYKFNRNTWLDSTIEHTSKAFLGITINCARCHEHKYDPIDQKEYYQFRAIFEPHQVRTDRVIAQADITKDGLPHVYDANLKTPTFIFERGNDKKPLKEEPITASIPAIFGVDQYQLEPVQLPPTAYYPGLRPEIQQAILAEVEQTITDKQKAFDAAFQAVSQAKVAPPNSAEKPASSASKKPAGKTKAKTPLSHTAATNALIIAEKQLLIARTHRATLQARIAADIAKYATPPASNAKQLAEAASKSERLEKQYQADLALTQAEQAFKTAKNNLVDTDAKSKKVVDDAQKKLTSAQKKLTDAKKATENVATNYSPLSPVYPTTSTGRRLALARWIANKKNPLTARVAINQIWMRHFGQPLVPTVFEFGMNGKPPRIPELFDWLACELMDPTTPQKPTSKPWQMKHIHRLIVLSNTYRMKSVAETAAESNLQLDPDNNFLWKMNSRRMESETVRDSVLSIAGNLDLTMGGPELDQASGQSTFRRSIYYRHAPEKFMTFLKLFDAPSTHECYRRIETVVPQQALAMVNSQISIEQARHLATNLNKTPHTKTSHEFIEKLFMHVLCRKPTASEQATCLQFLTEQTNRLTDTKKLTAFTGGGKTKVAASTEPYLRARESLAHVLLNHNEFVTIR